MANISLYLIAIKEAIFGKDVRNAIYKSIEAINSGTEDIAESRASITEFGMVKLHASTTEGVLTNKSGLRIHPETEGLMVVTKPEHGVRLTGTGEIEINPADVTEAKSGTEDHKPITPLTLKAVLDSGVARDYDTTGGTIKDKFDEIENSKAPKSHASSGTTYGKGTGNNYGHVKLSDAIDSESSLAEGTAATPKAVKFAAEAPAQSLDGNAVALDGNNSITSITVNGVFDGSRQEIDCPITASDYNATGGTIKTKFDEIEDRVPIFGACSTSSNDAIKDVYLGKDYADEQPIVIRFTDSVKPLSSGALKLRVWTGSSGTPIAYPVKFDSQDDIVVAGGEFTDNDVIVNNHSYLTVVRIYNDAYPEDTYWQIVSSDYNYAIKSKVAALEARIAALEQHALLDSSYTNPNNN